MTPSQKTLKLISDVGKLKLVKRTGWVRDGVKDAESVADHSYRTAFLAMMLSKKAGLDENKLIKMALVHDIGEAFAGDIVHERGNDRIKIITKKKSKSESNAIQEMFADFEDKETYNLWEEYEFQKTEEAKFVKQLDKLEMAMQAYEYEQQTGLTLQEYFDNVKMHLTHPELIKIFEEILKQREKARKN